jgi:hypothetical protein
MSRTRQYCDSNSNENLLDSPVYLLFSSDSSNTLSDLESDNESLYSNTVYSSIGKYDNIKNTSCCFCIII